MGISIRLEIVGDLEVRMRRGLDFKITGVIVKSACAAEFFTKMGAKSTVFELQKSQVSITSQS